MKGHRSCRDTFSGILRCPLKTGFTVLYILVVYITRQKRLQFCKICVSYNVCMLVITKVIGQSMVSTLH